MLDCKYTIDCMGCGKSFNADSGFRNSEPMLERYPCEYRLINDMLTSIRSLEGDGWRAAQIAGFCRLGCYAKAVELSKEYLHRPPVSAVAVAVLYPIGLIGDRECREILATAEKSDDKDVNAVLDAIEFSWNGTGTFELEDGLDPWALIQISRVIEDTGVTERICAALIRHVDGGTGYRMLYLYEEYCRISVRMGNVPQVTKLALESHTMWMKSVLKYRAAVTDLMNSDRDSAIKKFRGVCSTIFNDYMSVQETMLCGAFAALVVHHSGYRYSKKNLLSYSVMWACKTLDAGLFTKADFDEYLAFMLPLALEEMPIAGVEAMLSKNGVKDYALPEPMSEEFDPLLIPHLDSQYLAGGWYHGQL